MRNKCLFALGVVFAMSLTSIVAFAFSFTGEPEAKNDLRQIIAVDSVAESEEPTTEQTTVPAESEETTATLQPSDSSLLGSIDWDVEDAYMLAKIAMAEAESEDTEGKALVMLVVLNRVWSDEFPDTIAGVILQDGQFSPISNGRYDEVEPDADCYRALQLIQIDGYITVYHKITDYYFDQFSCLYKEVHTYDKELEEFCLKNKSVISIYDEYGRNVDWRL